MESNVCSRSQGQPPGPRNRAMMETARSNRSPVVGMGFNLNDIVTSQQMNTGKLVLRSRLETVRPGKFLKPNSCDFSTARHRKYYCFPTVTLHLIEHGGF